MKVFSSSTLLSLLILRATSAIAGDLETVLAKTASRTQPALAAKADVSFARAIEISGSKFSVGTPKEFRTELDKAAILGHEGAAELLCMLNSHEALGAAFFRVGYFWCLATKSYFTGKDSGKTKAAEERLAYVTNRLGSDLYLGQEYEALMLERMLQAAIPVAESR